jgi:hypothetical protein
MLNSRAQRQRERWLRRQAERASSPPVVRRTFWHGSKDGLAIGTVLLPPRERGIYRTERKLAAAGLDDLAEQAGQYVFVTDCAHMALAFAGQRRRPALYEVSVDGAITGDPDGEGRSWMCERATIIRQVPVPAKVLRELVARSQAGYQVRDNRTWLQALLEPEEDAAA